MMFLDYDFYKFNKVLLTEYIDEVLKGYGDEELDLKTCYDIAEAFETMVYLNGLYIDNKNRYQGISNLIMECKDDDYKVLKEKIEDFALVKSVFNRLMNSIHLNIQYNMHVLKSKKDIKDFILNRLDPIVKEKLDHMKL